MQLLDSVHHDFVGNAIEDRHLAYRDGQYEMHFAIDGLLVPANTFCDLLAPAIHLRQRGICEHTRGANAPSEATCLINPNSVLLNGSSSSTVAVTVTTTAKSAIPFPSWPIQGNGRVRPQFPSLGMWLVLGLLGLSAMMYADSRHARSCKLKPVLWRMMLTAVLTGETMLAACGGGGGGGSVSPQNPGTPAGSYSLMVTGSSGGLSHSMMLTLTVN